MIRNQAEQKQKEINQNPKQRIIKENKPKIILKPIQDSKTQKSVKYITKI